MEKFIDEASRYKYAELFPSESDIDCALFAEEGEVINDWRVKILENTPRPLLNKIRSRREVRYLFED